MKNFYSLDEYCSLYKDLLTKPYYDQFGREIIKELLKTIYKISTENIYDTYGKCWYDLAFNKDGHNYAFEVKQRHSTSKYVSHLINIEKFKSAENAILNNKFENVYVASIWEDGAIWVNNILDTNRYEKIYWQNSTTQVSAVTDGHKVSKLCVCYKPQNIYYVAMHYINNTGTELDGTWKIIVRKDPINIEQLEDAWTNRNKEQNYILNYIK